MQGIYWEASSVGFGLRGANNTDLTVEFTEAVNFLTDEQPAAPIVFNHSPTSTLEMLRRFVPIGEDCKGKPGKDLVSLDKLSSWLKM
jgi:hypothetical protein